MLSKLYLNSYRNHHSKFGIDNTILAWLDLKAELTEIGMWIEPNIPYMNVKNVIKSNFILFQWLAFFLEIIDQTIWKSLCYDYYVMDVYDYFFCKRKCNINCRKHICDNNIGVKFSWIYLTTKNEYIHKSEAQEIRRTCKH